MAEQLTPLKSLWSMDNPHQSRYFPRRTARTAADGGPTPVQRKQVKGRSSRRKEKGMRMKHKRNCCTLILNSCNVYHLTKGTEHSLCREWRVAKGECEMSEVKLSFVKGEERREERCFT